MSTYRKIVEAELERFLPPATTPPHPLHEAMRYSVFAGGKRIRPIFTIAAAECLGAAPEVSLPAATAIELLHTYTLIHDDLPCMDDDDFRRGRPSCHKVYGEAYALLAGDALLTLAFEAAAQSPFAAAANVRTLASAAGSRGIVGGQIADLAAANQKPDEAMLRFIHEHKTADLFRAALEMGGLSAHANQEALEALRIFGQSTGMAFQLIDDLLDADNPEDDSFSCVRIMGEAWTRQEAATWTSRAMDALRPFGDAARTLRALAKHLLERTS